MATFLRSKEWYLNEVFGHWPHWAASLRYGFSWFLRSFGLAVGVGLLFHREIFRKLALCLAWFTIATIYWKHPVENYHRHVQGLGEQMEPLFRQLGYRISFEQLTMPALMINYLLDLGFCLCLIYYFSRPPVVKLYQARHQDIAHEQSL